VSPTEDGGNERLLHTVALNWFREMEPSPLHWIQLNGKVFITKMMKSC